MKNIVKFAQGKDTAFLCGLFRYDYGQQLIIEGLNLPDDFEVHFQTQGDIAPVIKGCRNGDEYSVSIPDEILQQAVDETKAWIYLDDKTSGKTIKTIVMHLNDRDRPSSIPPQEDVATVKGYAEYVKENAEKVSQAQAAGDRAEKIADELIRAKENGEFNGKDAEPITIDSKLSETSANPIANSAVSKVLKPLQEFEISSYTTLECNEYREDAEEYIVPYINIGVPNRHTISIPKLSGGIITGWLTGANYRLSKLDISEYIGKKVRICGVSRSTPTYPCAFCTADDDMTVIETYGNDSNTVYGYTIEHPELTTFKSKDAIEAVIPHGAKYLYIMGALSTNSGTVVFDAVTALEVPVFDKSIADAVKELQSPLLNKKLSVDGDSICFGNGYAGGFGKIIADKYGMDFQNNAVGGATIAIGTVNALSFAVQPDWNNVQYYLKVISFDYVNHKSADSFAFPISQDEYINGFGVYPTTYKLVDGEMQEQPYSETMPSGTSFIKFDIPTYDDNTVSKYYRIWNIAEHQAFWEHYRSGFGTADYVSGDTQLYTARHWLCKGVSQLDSNSDYIVIEGGINEYMMGRRLGSLTDDMTSPVDITTTVGATEYMCRQLLEHFADKKILFVITHKAKEYWRTKNMAPIDGYTLQEYYDAIATVLKKYSIPYVNLSEKSRLNTELEQFLVYTHNSDGVHPNKEGYDLFYVPLIMNELERL